MLVIVVIFVSLLMAFSTGFIVGSIMVQRSLVQFVMAAVERSRLGVKRGEPKYMVEAAGIEELALDISRRFLRSK